MTSKILAMITAGLLAASGVATAAPVLLGTTINPTGVTGLVVDGVTYDVSFSTASYNATYLAPPTFLGNAAGAVDAATALRTVLNAAGVTGLLGSNCQTNGFGCALFIPDGIIPGTPAQIKGSILFNSFPTSTWNQTIFSGGNLTDPKGCGNSGGLTCQEFVVFTAVAPPPVAVPEPATLALVGAALAGVAFSRRRQPTRAAA